MRGPRSAGSRSRSCFQPWSGSSARALTWLAWASSPRRSRPCIYAESGIRRVADRHAVPVRAFVDRPAIRGVRSSPLLNALPRHDHHRDWCHGCPRCAPSAASATSVRHHRVRLLCGGFGAVAPVAYALVAPPRPRCCEAALYAAVAAAASAVGLELVDRDGLGPPAAAVPPVDSAIALLAAVYCGGDRSMQLRTPGVARSHDVFLLAWPSDLERTAAAAMDRRSAGVAIVDAASTPAID
jgi:hypothetical protein